MIRIANMADWQKPGSSVGQRWAQNGHQNIKMTTKKQTFVLKYWQKTQNLLFQSHGGNYLHVIISEAVVLTVISNVNRVFGWLCTSLTITFICQELSSRSSAPVRANSIIWRQSWTVMWLNRYYCPVNDAGFKVDAVFKEIDRKLTQLPSGNAVVFWNLLTFTCC